MGYQGRLELNGDGGISSAVLQPLYDLDDSRARAPAPASDAVYPEPQLVAGAAPGETGVVSPETSQVTEDVMPDLLASILMVKAAEAVFECVGGFGILLHSAWMRDNLLFGTPPAVDFISPSPLGMLFLAISEGVAIRDPTWFAFVQILVGSLTLVFVAGVTLRVKVMAPISIALLLGQLTHLFAGWPKANPISMTMLPLDALLVLLLAAGLARRSAPSRNAVGVSR